MNVRTGRALTAGAVLAITLGGCSDPGPSQEEVMTRNEEAHAEIRRLADEASEVVLAATRELDLEEITDGIQESWSSCTDDPFGPDDPPESINWAYLRSFRAPSDADTTAHAAALAPTFVEHGWAPRQGSASDGLRIERFGNDEGYLLEVSGSVSDGDEANYLVVTVLSPCVPAPPDLEW